MKGKEGLAISPYKSLEVAQSRTPRTVERRAASRINGCDFDLCGAA
jgi:hypothetical protein